MQNNEAKTTETKEQENFTTEIFHEFKIHSRIATVGLMILLAMGIVAFYANDEKWRDLFSSYDYVSQDGEGQNYYNNDIGGDVNNGAAGKEAEGQE